jgi:hypothetical protein
MCEPAPWIFSVMPRPNLVICGSSPVAVALARLAAVMGFSVTACAPPSERQAFEHADTIDTASLVADVFGIHHRFTEGATRRPCAPFWILKPPTNPTVGSRKMAAIREKLINDGASRALMLGARRSDIGAIFQRNRPVIFAKSPPGDKNSREIPEITSERHHKNARATVSPSSMETAMKDRKAFTSLTGTGKPKSFLTVFKMEP